MRPASAYSTRGRIGLIVPPTNTVNESEWARLVPEGVTVHSQRMCLHPDVHTPEGAAALQRDLHAAIDMLRPMVPDVVAHACTAGSMVVPSDSLPRAVSATAGLPVITTADSIIRALRHIGARKVSIATPYHDALNTHEVAFLVAHGIETLAIRGLGLGQNGPSDFPRIAQVPLNDIDAHVRSTVQPDSDAILITCTDFPTLPLIAGLEADFGIPVITSNTATLWAALQNCSGSKAPRAGGRLLQAEIACLKTTCAPSARA